MNWVIRLSKYAERSGDNTGEKQKFIKKPESCLVQEAQEELEVPAVQPVKQNERKLLEKAELV